MQEKLDMFLSHLQKYDRENALNYAMGLLAAKQVTVPELYEGILTPALNSILICREEEDTQIWKEHATTNIVRTVVECTFPYVAVQKNPATTQNSRHTVAVVCPEEEYHDIGARMGADFFALENYNVLFVGGNTPLNNILSLCKSQKPAMLALSVSNFFHLSRAKAIVAAVQALEHPPRILLSGSAFLRSSIKPQDFGNGTLVHTYRQVQELGGQNL